MTRRSYSYQEEISCTLDLHPQDDKIDIPHLFPHAAPTSVPCEMTKTWLRTPAPHPLKKEVVGGGGGGGGE